MEASEILYRIEVTKYSRWRVYLLFFCVFLYILTIAKWPYELPFLVNVLFVILASFLLCFAVHQARPLAPLKKQYSARQRKLEHANGDNYPETEEGVILLTSVGDIQFRGITDAPNEGRITHQSFYLFGVYHLVVSDKLFNRSFRYVVFGDQMNEQGNRRLRRVINRVKHAPTEA